MEMIGVGLIISACESASLRRIIATVEPAFPPTLVCDAIPSNWWLCDRDGIKCHRPETPCMLHPVRLAPIHVNCCPTEVHGRLNFLSQEIRRFLGFVHSDNPFP